MQRCSTEDDPSSGSRSGCDKAELQSSEHHPSESAKQTAYYEGATEGKAARQVWMLSTTQTKTTVKKSACNLFKSASSFFPLPLPSCQFQRNGASQRRVRKIQRPIFSSIGLAVSLEEVALLKDTRKSARDLFLPLVFPGHQFRGKQNFLKKDAQKSLRAASSFH